MSDAVLFVLIFGGLFVLRIIAATIVFFWILPRGDRCPNCDAPTIWVQGRAVARLMPWFRSSWCIACGWHGMLRHGEVTPPSAGAPVIPSAADGRGSAESRARRERRALD